ncbi:MAG: hypothetical protein SF097_21435 [Acidobacteriota bacterium]|nr:hypothetical protein [Acidobacteriota bacterium]
MAQELRLILTFEHLPAHDEVTNNVTTKWTLGMVISAATTEPLAADKLDLLRPWLWSLAGSFAYRIDVGATEGIVNPAAPDLLVPATFRGQPIATYSGLRNHAIAALDDELLRIADPDDVVWKPEGRSRVAAQVQSGISAADGKARRPWHTILGQASRYAAPIPQALNLSHVFRIPALAATSEPIKVLAAPILNASTAFPLQTKPVPAELKRDDTRGGVYYWPYDQPALDGIPVVAYFMPAVIRRRATANPNQYFDLGSLWVNSPTGTQAHDEEDWRALLEQRMADSLDLGARILEACRPRVNATFRMTATQENRLAVERLVLSGLRDIAGIGYRAAPGGKCLINMALATQATQAERKPLVESPEKPAAESPIRSLIEQQVAAEFGGAEGLKKWKKLLRETIPELSGARVLAEEDPNPAAAATLDETAFERSLGELEHVRQTVLRAPNLENVVRAQWRLIARDKENKVIGELERLAKLAERAEFPFLDARSLLAKENLWAFWRNFIGLIKPTNDDPSGRTELANNLPLLFETYFRKRFVTDLPIGDFPGSSLSLPNYTKQHPLFPDPPSTPPNPLSTPAGVIRAVLDEIRFFSPRAAQQLIAGRPISAQNPSDDLVEPTDVPHAITLQIDSLGELPADTPGDPDSDLLDHIAGVGILMREKPATASNGRGWKCLNFASPKFRGQGNEEKILSLVPLRIGYQNDVRFSSVTYNNQPISAESPIGGLSVYKMEAPERDPLRSPDAAEKQGDRVSPLVSYLTPAPDVIGVDQTGKPKRLLPGLKFGSTYEVLPFLMTNSGALPRALAPSQPYDPDWEAFDSERAEVRPVVRNKIRTVPYLRKVRVGEIRMLAPASGKKLNFPSVPEGVALRLRDMNTALLLPSDMSEADRRKEHPIILLRPADDASPDKQIWDANLAQDSFTFLLRKPATDINTWDRWVAREESNRDLRKAVYAAYHYRCDLKKGKDTRDETEDVSIDDPAVLDFIFAELVEVGGTNPQRNWGRYPLLAETSDNALTRVRRQPITVISKVDGGFSLEHSANRATLTLHLTKGKIYRLTFWSCVAPKDVLKVSNLKRFDNIFFPTPIEFGTSAPDGSKVVRVSPLSLFLECATEELLAPDEMLPDERDNRQVLFNALSAKFESSGGQDQLRVKLLNSTGAVKSFRYLQRAELSRQVWRWQGRETALHPGLTMDETASDYLDQVELWETREFGNREDLDCMVVEMETTTDQATASRSFQYLENLVDAGDVNQRRTGSGELRALHYRFSVKLFSRYAPLLKKKAHHSVQSEQRLGVASAGDKSRSIWKPRFIPCRRTTNLDPPKLKFILPLTESFEKASNGSAGVLVVFDEPWHEIGGLAESLVVEVAPYVDPSLPPSEQGNKPFVFEAGPDPIISSEVKRELSQPSDMVEFRQLDNPIKLGRVRGPIGHTFDQSNIGSHFLATSFIVPAPITKRAATTADPEASPAYHLPWSFAKLRFQRKILIKGELNPPKSPFTSPCWVQFIPEFSILSGSTASLLVKREGEKRVAILKDGSDIQLPPPREGGMFERYLVLTRRISDIRGQKTHEVFLAVFAREVGTHFWKLLESVPGGDTRIPAGLAMRARLIDVQRHSTAAPIVTEADLWERIFSKSTRDSKTIRDLDRYRIVMVSEPIESHDPKRPE